MAEHLDSRTYDLLRLVDAHAPIGSIRLVELMQQHGYSLKDRTVRLTLSELDEAGVTEKVPGKGRRLTEKGAEELRRGGVDARRERVRAYISKLTSRVTYDPVEDAGDLIAATATVRHDRVDDAFALLEQLSNTKFGPVLVAVDPSPAAAADTVDLHFPSSVTFDGVLLTHGVNFSLNTAGLVEYHPDPSADVVPEDSTSESAYGGRVLRYVDVINGEGSSIDVVSLLIEAGRTDVQGLVEDGSPGLVVVDNLEVPLTRYEETCDLASATQESLGGIVDLRRPRASGPFPFNGPSWDFASVTNGGGEIPLSLLVEADLAESWETLHGIVSRKEFEPVSSRR